MAAIAADRHLLFGLLALQNGLIDQGQLVAAFQAWTRDKSRSLADQLVARGDLDADARAGLEAIVDLHVKKHGDVEKSLAAISAGKSTQESLARIRDRDIEASLGHVGLAHGSTLEGEQSEEQVAFWGGGGHGASLPGAGHSRCAVGPRRRGPAAVVR